VVYSLLYVGGIGVHLGAMVKVWLLGVKVEKMTKELIPALLTSSIFLSRILDALLFIIHSRTRTAATDFTTCSLNTSKRSHIPNDLHISITPNNIHI